MYKATNNSGQSSVEFVLVLGLVVIPALAASFGWVKAEWSRSECAFQTFKIARQQLLQTQQRTVVNGITLVPLEDLDQNKGGLEVSDALKEVSQLWEQLSSSLPSSSESADS